MRRLIGALLAASILVPAGAQAQREGYRGEGRRQIERGGPRSNDGDRPTRPDRGADGFRADRPRPDGPRPDTPRPDTRRPDTPRPDTPRYDAPRGDGPRGDRWAGGADRRDDGPRDRSDWRRDRPGGVGAGDIPRGADLRAGRPDRAAIEASRRPTDDRRFSDGRRDDDGRDRDRDWAGSRFGGDRGGYGRGDRGDWNGDGRRGGWDDRGRGNAGWSGRDGNRWDRGWHGQSRYDWTRYRDANRGAFRLPRYDAPGGWNGGYRRFGIGFSLSGALWSRNYWIADPYAYRLPEVYGPYRWVRYYDDALLVDVRSGQVVDAVYGIFW